VKVESWPLLNEPAADRWTVHVDDVGKALRDQNLVRSGVPRWRWDGDVAHPHGSFELTITGGEGEGSATLFRVDWASRTLSVAFTHADEGGWFGTADLLNRWIVPMIARALGDLPLHACSVARNSSALLLAGDSGTGKSTLTAALVSSGWGLLGDEPAVVQTGDTKLGVWPGAALLRLLPEAAGLMESNGRTSDGRSPRTASSDTGSSSGPENGGQEVTLRRAGSLNGKLSFFNPNPNSSSEPVPVKAIAFIGPRTADGGVVLQRLTPREALARLIGVRYSAPNRPDVVKADLAPMAHVAASERVIEIQLPNGVHLLPDAATQLEGLLAECVN
jgi:hypothetical protein